VYSTPIGGCAVCFIQSNAPGRHNRSSAFTVGLRSFLLLSPSPPQLPHTFGSGFGGGGSYLASLLHCLLLHGEGVPSIKRSWVSNVRVSRSVASRLGRVLQPVGDPSVPFGATVARLFGDTATPSPSRGTWIVEAPSLRIPSRSLP